MIFEAVKRLILSVRSSIIGRKVELKDFMPD